MPTNISRLYFMNCIHFESEIFAGELRTEENIVQVNSIVN